MQNALMNRAVRWLCNSLLKAFQRPCYASFYGCSPTTGRGIIINRGNVAHGEGGVCSR